MKSRLSACLVLLQMILSIEVFGAAYSSRTEKQDTSSSQRKGKLAPKSKKTPGSQQTGFTNLLSNFMESSDKESAFLKIKNFVQINDGLDLSQQANGLNVLHVAILMDDLPFVKVILKRTGSNLINVPTTAQDTVDFEFHSKSGKHTVSLKEQTPLHLATATGNFKVIEVLIANGANKEALNGLNQKPKNCLPENCDQMCRYVFIDEEVPSETVASSSEATAE